MSLTRNPASLSAQRLRRLPQESLDVWELAIVRLPQWVVGEPRPPYRLHTVLVVSREQDLIGTGDSGAPEDASKLGFLDALARLAAVRGMGYRPARIAVRDAALVARLRAEVEPLGIDVELAPELPAIDRVAAELVRGFGAEAPVPGALDGRGVTVERMRAFAEAAAEFVRAAPWNDLTDADLVHVEAPEDDPDLAYLALSGGHGEHVGLTFFESPLDHEEMGEGDDSPALDLPRWVITFEPVHELPLADADLWEDHALPMADADHLPCFWRSAPGAAVLRPDAETLAWAEALLRALAATTEDELDEGRWVKRVRSADGEVVLRLALPGLLGSPLARRGGEPPADDEARRALAEVKLDAAFDASGRVQQRLAREAIALWPDCADAWVLRAGTMPDPARAEAYYERAREAARRTLGDDAFGPHAEDFGVRPEARPYMRALAGLAELRWEADDAEAALRHWHELLRLDPGDHLGIRLVLAPRLLEESRDDEAGRVLANYDDDGSAVLEFSRALLAFRREGASAAADEALARATRANALVLKFLLGNADAGLVEQDGYYSPGDEREAAAIDDELGVAFEQTPGALEWLRGHRRRAKKSRETKRRGR